MRMVRFGNTRVSPAESAEVSRKEPETLDVVSLSGGDDVTARQRRQSALVVRLGEMDRRREECARRHGRVFARLDARRADGLQSKLALDDHRSLTGCALWRFNRKMAWRRTKTKWAEVAVRLQLWRGSFKTIEGHFGSGVAAYFVFLKWLFVLNLWIFALTFLFIVLPQIIFVAQGYDWWVVGDTSDARLNQSAVCSELYKTTVDYSDIKQTLLDFLQGTGWMEPTVLYYGYYSDRRLAIGTFNGETYSYNMPLAYILVTVSYIAVSLVSMVRHTASGMKARIVEGDDKLNLYCGVVFSSWDYTLNDPKSVNLKHKNVYNELRADLDEERRREKRAARTGCSRCGLYTIRFVINVFVIACLAGAGYLIYYVTEVSQQFTEEPDYASLNGFVKLLMEYLPSLTITFLNFLLPFLFQKIVRGEDYSPDTEVQVTLGRTVFLRLASLAVLLATIYLQITCSDVDECDVGVPPTCPQIRCWETYIGQQVYKLVIMDFIVVLLVTLLVQFPRALIATRCSCKLAKIIGKPEFEIPKNVLDLVYSQTLCWLGAFFSPLIPAICVLKSFIVFYLKKVTCLYNHVPSSRPYRASKSHAFFMIVLLTAFLLTCVPIGYILWKLAPSKGCGPFRVYTYMYDIISITIATWPAGVQEVIAFIISAGFMVPLFVLLCVLVYYFAAVGGAHRESVRLLKDQLTLEGKDKQFLLQRINQLSGEGPPGRGKTIGDRSKQPPAHAVTVGHGDKPRNVSSVDLNGGTDNGIGWGGV